MSSGNKRSLAFLHTIGARLTLWGGSLTLLSCVCVCILLYAGLRLSLTREIDDFLEGEVCEFRSILTEEDSENELLEVEGEIRRELGSRLRSDLTFRLLDQSGRLLLTSASQDPLPNPWKLDPVGQEDSWFSFRSTVTSSGRKPVTYRVCSQWIKLRGDRACVAQAAYVMSGVESSLAHFRQVCLTTLLAASILALGGGYFLSRRSLRPVGDITATARNIGARQLSQRITRSGNGDELDLLAETLNDMLERIENHVRQVQQFTADASHELRTPLAALRGTTEVALSRPRTAEELRCALEENMDHYARLGRIADDLLLLARADVGQLPLNRELITLNQAIMDVVDLYTPLAQESGLELRMNDGPEVRIHADGSRIRQLLGNLIDNAVKYTGCGKQITVALGKEEESATIRITDNGPGIAATDLPHVFDRFYRASHAHRSRTTGGAGLGLPICRIIAELHGGTIRLESPTGCGTEVIVTLPLSPRISFPATPRSYS